LDAVAKIAKIRLAHLVSNTITEQAEETVTCRSRWLKTEKNFGRANTTWSSPGENVVGSNWQGCGAKIAAATAKECVNGRRALLSKCDEVYTT
jgi:hypothetical protein